MKFAVHLNPELIFGLFEYKIITSTHTDFAI